MKCACFSPMEQPLLEISGAAVCGVDIMLCPIYRVHDASSIRCELNSIFLDIIVMASR